MGNSGAMVVSFRLGRAFATMGKFDAEARRRKGREEIGNGGAMVVRFRIRAR